MNVLDNLRAARALIERPEAWTQEYYAIDTHGFMSSANSPDAIKFCALGAICRIQGVPDPFPDDEYVIYAAGAENALQRANGGDSVVAFNDERTHAEVLALFDKAIEQEARKAREAVKPTEARNAP